MMKVSTKNEHRSCQICGAGRTRSLHPAVIVRPALAEEIQSDLGQWDPEGWICDEDLQRYRHKHVEGLLQVEEQRRIADAIYRLITCESSRDIKFYMEEKGIRWDTGEVNTDEQVEGGIQEGESEIQELVRSSLIASIGTSPERESSVPAADTNESAEDTGQNSEEDTEALVLPPIEEVNPMISNPSNDWSPNLASRRSGGRSGSWSPPTRRDRNRDMEVGR